MFTTSPANSTQKTTSWKIVVPFYSYAALSFLGLTILLLFAGDSFSGHYFQPRLLAITHMATLGWGTMIILGASHQLLPVLVDGKLYSEKLAKATFITCAIGIPLLVYNFWYFQTVWLMQLGAVLVLSGFLLFALNVFRSIWNSNALQVQVYFLFTATLWLCLTALLGTLLVFNFTYNLFSVSHLEYLRLHAHMGLVGWFLMLVAGVASRLLPMFMISKYSNDKLLLRIFWLINGGLVLFLVDVMFAGITYRVYLYLCMLLAGILLFVVYCRQAWKQRIRKKVEAPVKLSLAAVALLMLPLITAAFLIIQIITGSHMALRLSVVYGSLFLLGWLTAIILGMTFKTLPFIIWNKVYQRLSGKQATPSPKDLFSNRLITWQIIFYVPGFILVEMGILLQNAVLLKTGSVLLLATAIVYNVNVGKLVFHRLKRRIAV